MHVGKRSKCIVKRLIMAKLFNQMIIETGQRFSIDENKNDRKRRKGAARFNRFQLSDRL